MLINNNGVDTYYYYLFNLQGDVVGIMDSSGNTVTEYTYDAWGQLLTTTGNTELGNKNPLRYRGYYYDSETGFYYLKSRYYDPYVQRFINADGYVSTGQGITGHNMFAYCNNNPVNMVDQNGEASTIAQWWTSTMGWLCAVDTALPIGDIIYVGVAAVLWGAAICGVSIAADKYVDSASTEKEEEKDIAPAIPKDPPKKETVIYRYGGTNPGNFVPSPRDVATNSGLSFLTSPPPPGTKASVTTIEALNATGVVRAYQDKPGHVRVDPVIGTLADWHAGGSEHTCTIAVRSVVVKWDGGN